MKIGNATSTTPTTAPVKEAAGAAHHDNSYKYERFIPRREEDQLHLERNNQLDMLRRMAMGGR